MTNMQILDCTLRDGGYINNFDFGEKGIKEIINQLTNAGIDIIETGFLQALISSRQDSCRMKNIVSTVQFITLLNR